MFDIGWSEMAVIALVALVVIGPKDLPKAMKTVAFWVRKARRLASEFHSGIDQLVREAELEEARDAIRSASQMNLDRAVEQAIDPTGEVDKALQLPADTEAAPPAPPVIAAAEEPPALPPAPPTPPSQTEPAKAGTA
jgi:sec-independent protein translocase protein TatB